MSKLQKNTCKVENINGDTIITILEDKNILFGVDMTNCKVITTKNGSVKDEYTTTSLHQMYKYCNENKASKKQLKLDIRNKLIELA